MPQNAKLDLLQGTLDLLVLQDVGRDETARGYGIARRIEQSSGDEVLLNQSTGTRPWCACSGVRCIAAEWGIFR